ncbi:MAG: hypothetical protein ACPLRO_01090, partial [Candidatus Kapaibacteriota bacterium]
WTGNWGYWGIHSFTCWWRRRCFLVGEIISKIIGISFNFKNFTSSGKKVENSSFNFFSILF